MSKFIIENKSDKDDLTAMAAVRIVIGQGRVGKRYPPVTPAFDVRVLYRRNDKSHGFIVINKESGT